MADGVEVTGGTDGSPEVTFVGGKAVEQTESIGSDMPADEREAAKEAVRKAIQEAGESSAKDAKENRAKDPYKPAGTKSDSEDGTPERGPDGKFLPRDGSGPAKAGRNDSKQGDGKGPEESTEEDIDPATASVKQLLKQREKVAALKKDAKDEISKERQSIQAEAQKIQQYYAELNRQKAALDRERQNLAMLKKDPARAVREAGWDPEQFILDLAEEGTPEGQQKRQYKELQAQIQEMKDWKAQQAKAAEEAQYRQYMHQAEQHRHHAVKTFLDLGTSEEKYPHVATFYQGREKLLIAAGDLIAEEFRNLSGREGSYEQILDYLEDELASSANKWYSKKHGAQKVAPPKEVVSPSKSKGKSLSPEASGERRAHAPKDLKDLDADERHEAAKQAVAVALAASKRND